jgi:8-oxo-dGTP pyrophosphatase MutT (NUDIX family)
MIGISEEFILLLSVILINPRGLNPQKSETVAAGTMLVLGVFKINISIIQEETAMSTSLKKWAQSSSTGKIGAGIVLVRNTSEGPCFLLLRGADTGVWSFPKGHTENIDRGDAMATAIRETLEETGYQMDIDYMIVSDRFRLGKRPYWVGKMNATSSWTPRLAPREHSAFGWFYANDLEKLNANTDVRALVKHQKAHVASGRTEHCCCRVVAAVSAIAAH